MIFRSCAVIVLLGIGLRPLKAQDTAPVHDFVDGIYAWDSNDQADDPLPDEKVYTPALIHLFHDDQRRAGKGNIGKLDFDPLCSCQDAGGLKYALGPISMSGFTTSKVTVHLSDSNFSSNITLFLRRTPKGWRIDDVQTNKIASLRQFLGKE
ncbi:MAG: DUF3828 domain-containing protein [Acidobacteriaceae bacterium]|nr:DUF3828 domain-containing protein [Acidobacteriaceae bacterium]